MMKAVFIIFNQAYNEEITDILAEFGQRGFTRWDEVCGRGSGSGIPRLGNHAWPELNNAVLSVIDDDKVGKVMDAVRAKDEQTPELGLRAFVWNIETFY